MLKLRLSDGFIQELKNRNEISDIISDYVSLKRKGHNLVGICPFHSEKTASFFVYPNSESFYCFGCGAGGDVITFLKMVENFDYIEAVKFLADRAGMAIPELEKNQDVHDKKTLIYEINREVARFYHRCLCESVGNTAMKYLLNRGLKMSTIKHFGLGYSPADGYSAVNYLRKKGYQSQDIVMANIAAVSKRGNPYDRFRDRVMFPIIDLRGNVIAFGGRILGDGQPKYLNTSDTIAFKKSDNVFALNFAKNKSTKNIILAEGYMDVISLHQAGFENTVATLGTALTDGQVKLLSRCTNEVVISYDSDNAGRKATDRAIKMFRDNGMLVKVINVPKGKDPDEFIKSYGKEGAIRFRNLIDAAGNDIEYRLQRAKVDYDLDKPDDKVKYLNECVKILCEIQNQIECEIYAGKLGQEIGIERKTILLQVERLKRKKNKNIEKKEFKEIQKSMTMTEKINGLDKESSLRAFKAEEKLLACIINNQDMVNDISCKINSDLFTSNLNRKIYAKICKLYSEERPIDVTTISENDFSVRETGYVAKLMCSYMPTQNINEDLDKYISIMKYESKAIQMTNANDVNDVNEYIKSLRMPKK